MGALLRELLLPCLWAFVACGGFSVLFHVRGLGVLICSCGGALGWLVYLLACRGGLGDISATLLAGVAISLWSEVMARVRKCPVTGYLLLAVFPLVPGGGIYYAMKYAVQGENQAFADTLMHTLGVSGALALGILLVASATRMWRNGRKSHGSGETEIHDRPL